MLIVAKGNKSYSVAPLLFLRAKGLRSRIIGQIIGPMSLLRLKKQTGLKSAPLVKDTL